jgi:hypothetical protein
MRALTRIARRPDRRFRRSFIVRSYIHLDGVPGKLIMTAFPARTIRLLHVGRHFEERHRFPRFCRAIKALEPRLSGLQSDLFRQNLRIGIRNKVNSSLVVASVKTMQPGFDQTGMHTSGSRTKNLSSTCTTEKNEMTSIEDEGKRKQEITTHSDS